MTDKAPQFLTPAQVVERWNNAVTTGTLANWRHKGTGPEYKKFGARVRYPLRCIEEYERTRGANDNTTQKAEGAA